jgi:hypothetical protein
MVSVFTNGFWLLFVNSQHQSIIMLVCQQELKIEKNEKPATCHHELVFCVNITKKRRNNEFCYSKNKYIHDRDVRSSALLVSVGL